jgi:hypothetical protein
VKVCTGSNSVLKQRTGFIVSSWSLYCLSLLKEPSLLKENEGWHPYGIRFAVPTALVAGHEEAGPMAAHQALKLPQPE